MINGIGKVPPSRQDKMQIIAHLDADFVDLVHKHGQAKDLTIQEMIGDAVNRAVAEFGRQPFLAVGRERRVKRMKSLAQIQTSANAPDCRTGKRRVAAWFDRKGHEQVASFAREVGIKIEQLVEKGLKLALAESKSNPPAANEAEQKAA